MKNIGNFATVRKDLIEKGLKVPVGNSYYGEKTPYVINGLMKKLFK